MDSPRKREVPCSPVDDCADALSATTPPYRAGNQVSEGVGFTRNRRMGSVNVPTWRTMTKTLEARAPRAGTSVVYDVVGLACDAGRNDPRDVLHAFKRIPGRRAPRTDHVRCNEEFRICRRMLNPFVWRVERVQGLGLRRHAYRFTRLRGEEGTVVA